jgi:hypothetical protein
LDELIRRFGRILAAWLHVPGMEGPGKRWRFVFRFPTGC